MMQHCMRRSRGMLTLAFVLGFAGIAQAGEPNHHSVLGTEKANCQQCHPSETAHWKKTTHFKSLDRLRYEGNAKKYADALKIDAAALASDSMCTDCHATKAVVDDQVVAISGVSCESCHGPSQDWLAVHSDYGLGHRFTSLESLRKDRQAEADEHRAQRIAAATEAGMIRPAAIKQLASNCMSCHVVGNEDLIAAGHKAASNIELAAWLNGEVRHNYFMDPNKNASAPSLHLSVTGMSPQERQREQLVAGTFAKLSRSLQVRANVSNPVAIPQVGGVVAATAGTGLQLVPLLGDAKANELTPRLATLLGTVFISMPGDRTTYTELANDISGVWDGLNERNTAAGSSALDAMLQQFPPHYSTQFQR